MHYFVEIDVTEYCRWGKKLARYARNLAFTRNFSRQEIISNKHDHWKYERKKKRLTSSLVPLKNGNVYMCSTIVVCTYKLSSLFIKNDLWRVRRREYSITNPRSYAFSKNRFVTRIEVAWGLLTNMEISKDKNYCKTCILV